MPLESAIDTVSLVAPAGALTAPAILPPLASVAVEPGASTDWPSRLAPLVACWADIAVCMLCRLDTSLRPSNWPEELARIGRLQRILILQLGRDQLQEVGLVDLHVRRDRRCWPAPVAAAVAGR